MNVVLAIATGVVLVWVLTNVKTSRPDGELIARLPSYRRLLTAIMPTRNEAVVYYDDYVKADALLEYIDKARKRFAVDITHCLVAAAAVGLVSAPRMNQFVSGMRLYRRNERTITFSMKRKKLDRKAKLSAVKLDMAGGETFEQLCTRINGCIDRERSGKKTAIDREYDIFNLLPRPLLRFFVRLLRWLDDANLLPGMFIKGDGMYTSMFIANLGSLGMKPGYHHLYEWGNCPLFMMAGRVEERPAVVDGQVVAQKTLHIRWSYDERIDDGLNSRYGMDAVRRVLENPYTYLGCLHPDGTDSRALDQPVDDAPEHAAAPMSAATQASPAAN